MGRPPEVRTKWLENGVNGGSSQYLPTVPVTRHRFLDDGEAEATTEPQYLVHLTQNEKEDVQRAFESAVENAGEAADRVVRDRYEQLVRAPRRDASGRSTLDLVVPWGSSALDVQDTTLLAPIFEEAVKDIHQKWQSKMNLKIFDVIQRMGDNLSPATSDVLQRDLLADKPSKTVRKFPQPQPSEREQGINTHELRELQAEVHTLRVQLTTLQQQCELARGALPTYVRQQTQQDLEMLAARFGMILKTREKEFRDSVDAVRDAAAVAVDNEIARVRSALLAQARDREEELLRRLNGVQDVACKANKSLVSDRDMREAEIQHLRRLLDRVHKAGLSPESPVPLEEQMARLAQGKLGVGQADQATARGGPAVGAAARGGNGGGQVQLEERVRLLERQKAAAQGEADKAKADLARLQAEAAAAAAVTGEGTAGDVEEAVSRERAAAAAALQAKEEELQAMREQKEEAVLWVAQERERAATEGERAQEWSKERARMQGLLSETCQAVAAIVLAADEGLEDARVLQEGVHEESERARQLGARLAEAEAAAMTDDQVDSIRYESFRQGVGVGEARGRAVSEDVANHCRLGVSDAATSAFSSALKSRLHGLAASSASYAAGEDGAAGGGQEEGGRGAGEGILAERSGEEEDVADVQVRRAKLAGEQLGSRLAEEAVEWLRQGRDLMRLAGDGQKSVETQTALSWRSEEGAGRVSGLEAQVVTLTEENKRLETELQITKHLQRLHSKQPVVNMAVQTNLSAADLSSRCPTCAASARVEQQWEFERRFLREGKGASAQLEVGGGGRPGLEGPVMRRWSKEGVFPRPLPKDEAVGRRDGEQGVGAGMGHGRAWEDLMDAMPGLNDGEMGERWLGQEGLEETWVQIGARHVRQPAPSGLPVERLLVPVGQLSASAAPKAPTNATSTSAGTSASKGPRPLSAITPRKTENKKQSPLHRLRQGSTSARLLQLDDLWPEATETGEITSTSYSDPYMTL